MKNFFVMALTFERFGSLQAVRLEGQFQAFAKISWYAPAPKALRLLALLAKIWSDGLIVRHNDFKMQ
jgi:hypothetical protein